MNCGERKRVPFHDSRVRWQGSEGRGKEACFACDVAMAFTSITSAGLPGVLIKITSGSSHMLILGALKDSANTSACSWEVGGGGAFICVPLCGRDVCVCVCLLCAYVHVCLQRGFFFSFARTIATVVGEAAKDSGWGGVAVGGGQTLCSVVSAERS